MKTQTRFNYASVGLVPVGANNWQLQKNGNFGAGGRAPFGLVPAEAQDATLLGKTLLPTKGRSLKAVLQTSADAVFVVLTWVAEQA